MATLQERITAAFTNLETLVTTAETAKDETAAVREFAGKLSSTLKFVDGLKDTDAGYKVLAAMGDTVESWVTTVDGLRSVSEVVSKVAGIDRAQGDESVNALKVLSGAPLFAFEDEPEAKAKADDLIARWLATAPTTRTRGEGSGNPPADLGFTVRASCQVAGCGYTASTGKDNLNSFRHQCAKHEKDTHKHLTVERGTEWHKGITAAMQKVMGGESDAQEGGNWVIVKAAQ